MAMFDGFMWNMMNRGTWACTIFNHPNSVAAAENENLGSPPSDMHALRAGGRATQAGREDCPHCLQSGGPDNVKERGSAVAWPRTDPLESNYGKPSGYVKHSY